jgi:hypothetical protein
LLASIPEDFQSPEDVLDFVESGPGGKEMIWRGEVIGRSTKRTSEVSRQLRGRNLKRDYRVRTISSIENRRTPRNGDYRCPIPNPLPIGVHLWGKRLSPHPITTPWSDKRETNVTDDGVLDRAHPVGSRLGHLFWFLLGTLNQLLCD